MSFGFSMTLVASSRPPMPVSRMTHWGARVLHITMNMRNANSKNVGCDTPSRSSFSAACLTARKASRNVPSSTLSPSKRNRSLTRTRWGDVKAAVFIPCSRRMDSKNAQTEPFPLVPATCMILKRRSGFPSSSRNRRSPDKSCFFAANRGMSRK